MHDISRLRFTVDIRPMLIVTQAELSLFEISLAGPAELFRILDGAQLG